ncbi:hypothetical protein [Paramicrobacterium agarici]|uniref:Uncharacterized protein n=1 Tax=Paramicrobacterium agarici TaxID=630514 RepID=A0A2A9DXU0_9MICO|nr:hypothetical protein [Microbacterium agarici]PFG31186.1 hypothetical protein ATJ78_2141 [Microbacterium agarici]
MSTQAADIRPTWEEITYRRGRNDLAWLFISAFSDGRLRDEDYCRALQDAWTGPDSPMAYADEMIWELLFRNVDFLVEDEESTCPLTGPTILYRGCSPDRLNRMSWSERPEVALSFAERYRRQGFDAHVWAAEFESDKALARFTKARPGENEWVMEPLAGEALAKAWIHMRLG